MLPPRFSVADQVFFIIGRKFLKMYIKLDADWQHDFHKLMKDKFFMSTQANLPNLIENFALFSLLSNGCTGIKIHLTKRVGR